MKLPIGRTLLIAAALCCVSADEPPTGEAWNGSAAEKELVQLVSRLYEQYAAYYEAAQKIADPMEQRTYYAEHDPAAAVMPKLLAFESQHSGTDVGLMALRRIILLAAGGGPADNPRDQARREAFQRLPKYAARPLLVEILRYVDAGNFEPASEPFLRTLAADAHASAIVRQYAQITLARWMIGWSESREFCERRLKELRAGEEPRFEGEEAHYANLRSILPPAAQLDTWRSEALRLLQQASSSTADLRQPAVTGIDPNWHLIRLDEKATEKMPRLSELAAGLLFKESHLRLGQPAPPLTVLLVDGSDWSLANQRGKAVIIQFSFKGCGPCEAMYPDLQALGEQYGARLAILSIMADQDRKDTEASVQSGKLSWHVTWDGYRGPVATKWAVQGFPTVYVVSPTGEIAGVDLRDKRLRAKIAELLK